MQRLRDSQPGRCQQADQRRVCLGPQRVKRRKPRGGKDQASDLVARINVWDPTHLPIAEVVRRWGFMPGVFQAKGLGKEAYGLVADVALRDRSRLHSPADGCCCADVRLRLTGSEASEAAPE